MAIITINTGVTPNDGTGDSIRDAFTKVNSNFDFLEASRVAFTSGINTGNLVVSTNFDVNSLSGTGNLVGYFTYNGLEIATVGTTFSGGFVANPTTFQNTNDVISGNLTSGGLVALGGLSVTKTFQGNIVKATSANVVNLVNAGSFYTTGNANVGNVNSTGQGIYAGNIRSTGGQLFISGNITGSANLVLFNGNVWSGNLNATNFLSVGGNIRTNSNISAAGNISGNYITGTLTTPVQTAITRVGVLSNLIVATTLAVNTSISTGTITGNLGTYDRVILNNLPISAQDAANRDYVDIQCVAYGLALG